MLILSFFLVLVLISCETKSDGGLLKITDAKGIPEVSEDDKKDDGLYSSDENHSDAIAGRDIILNTSSKKIHLSSECGYSSSIKEENKLIVSREQLEQYLESGYKICSNCNKKYSGGD